MNGGIADTASEISCLILGPSRRCASLMFSRSAYTASLGNYYTFYLIGKFGVSVQASQMLLFLLTMLLAGMVLSNLVEEKANKIIEILAAPAGNPLYATCNYPCRFRQSRCLQVDVFRSAEFSPCIPSSTGIWSRTPLRITRE
jgi:hypothetical protein